MASGSGIVYVNGKDLSDFGVLVERIDGLHDIPAATFQTSQAANRDGRILLGPTPATEDRRLTLVAKVNAGSQAALNGLLRRLRGFLSRGTLEIRTLDDLSVVYYAHLSRGPMQVPFPQHISDYAVIQIEFTCFDPAPSDILGSVVQVLGTPTPITIGDAIVLGELLLWGVATTPTVNIARADGKIVMSVPLSGPLGDKSLTSAQVLKLNNIDGTLALMESGGAWVDGVGYLGDTHDFPFHLDPLWGDPQFSAYPTIAVTGLGAGGGAEFRYKLAHP